MKNQYFGDSRDYFKYDLLLDVISSMPHSTQLTFIPMLTPNDQTKEGGVTKYSKGNRRESLFEFLQECVRESRRNVSELKSFLSASGFTHYFYRTDSADFADCTREPYFFEIPQNHLRSALIFIDPDIGLQRPSSRSGPEKHLRYAELAHVYGKMDSSSVLVAFQYLRSDDRLSYFKSASAAIQSLTRAYCVYWISGGPLAFVFLAKSRDACVDVWKTLLEHKTKHGLPYCWSANLEG